MNRFLRRIKTRVRGFLNRHKFKRLRAMKRWLLKQRDRIKHRCYVLRDACLRARCRRQYPVIKGKEETLSRIIRDKCSIARLGDGEFGLIFGKGLGFQKCEKELSDRLAAVLRANDSDRMLIGISEWIFYSDFGKYPEYRVQNLRRILNLLVPGKTYYSADISRFYKSTPDGSEALNQISLLKQIWNGRNVTIIEGEKSRMGVGNDLFDNVKSIKRILCPAENAFSSYGEIYQAALEKAPKEDLILIALGPTATVLAYDLFLAGYQAIDIGHADISYEWYLRGVKDPNGRVAIAGKYVYEAANGREVDDIDDADYAGQIIAKIGI